MDSLAATTLNATSFNATTASAASLNAISPSATALKSIASASAQDEQLRHTVNEVVGVTFFAPMLKTAHESVLKGKYGHGGRGEEMFQSQLDMEFARNIGRGIQTDLADALYRKLARKV